MNAYEIGWILFEAAICVLENFLLLDFITRLLGFRIERKGQIPAFMGAMFVGCLFSLIENLPAVRPVEFLITITLLFVYALLFLDGAIWQKLGTAVMIRGVLTLANSITLFLCSDIFGVSINQFITTQNSTRVVVVLLCKVIMFFLAQALLAMLRKDRKLNRWQWAVASTCLVFSTLAGTLSISLADHLGSNMEGEKIKLLVIVISIWFVCITTYFLITRMARDNRLRMENALLLQSQTYQTEAMETAKRTGEEVRQMKHDMKNSLQNIAVLIEGGHMQEVKQYCQQVAGKINQINTIVHTDNPVLNGFINYKLTASAAQGIDLRVAITTSLKKLDPYFFSTVFDNLMDNAMEAQEGLPKEKRFLGLTISRSMGMVTLRIENRIAESVLTNNPQLETTKQNKKLHGLGHYSVKRIMEECGGNIHYAEEADVFIVHALFPAPSDF